MKRTSANHPELIEAPHHLVLWILGMPAPLFDERIVPPKKWNEVFLCGSPVLWTPKGLPLTVSLSGKAGFHLYTAETLLLQIADATLSLHIRLLLPTDEVLTAEVSRKHSW